MGDAQRVSQTGHGLGSSSYGGPRVLGGRQRKSKVAAAAAAAVETAAIGGVVITPLLSIRLSGNGEKCAKNFVLHVGLMRRGK